MSYDFYKIYNADLSTPNISIQSSPQLDPVNKTTANLLLQQGNSCILSFPYQISCIFQNIYKAGLFSNLYSKISYAEVIMSKEWQSRKVTPLNLINLNDI